MRRNMLILFGIGLVMTLAISGATAFWFWQFRLRPAFIFSQTRYGHMRFLAAGISEFRRENGRLPKSLAEVVQGAYLPEVSPWYSCSIIHRSLRERPISYTECEFDMRFEPDQVIISLPRSVIFRLGLDAKPACLAECGVDSSGHHVHPGEVWSAIYGRDPLCQNE